MSACIDVGLDPATFLPEVFGAAAEDSPIARLERGEICLSDFGPLMSALLNQHRVDPSAPAIDGVAWLDRVTGLISNLGNVMVEATQRIVSADIPVVLLSNSWGRPKNYP